MRIFVHNCLKLLVRVGRAFFGRTIARVIWLRRHPCRPYGRLQHLVGFAEIYAGFFVLLFEVVPASEQRNYHDAPTRPVSYLRVRDPY